MIKTFLVFDAHTHLITRFERKGGEGITNVQLSQQVGRTQ